MEDKDIKLKELYARAKQGEIIKVGELSFLDTNYRDFTYQELLNFALEYRKSRNEDIEEIETLLYGTKEEREIKELEERLRKLKGGKETQE